MKLLFKNFLKGLLLGVFILPLEFSFLSLTSHPVKAQDDLRETIRSQINDLRQTRPCEEDPRQSCSRPIPTHRPSPEPQASPSPQPQPSPSPQPSVGPSPQPSVPPGASPSPSPSNGVGGNGGECEECEEEKVVEKVTETIIERAPVVGLSYTGSGRW